MIINHKYRFIYVKTKKTASTSVEIALSRYCDANDILTPIGGRDEPKRATLGYQGPANYLMPRQQWTREDLFRHYVLREEIVAYWNHMPALAIRERIGQGIFDSYFKFCFERNPWDRAISAYYWENRRSKQLPDFEVYLETLHKDNNLSNWPKYAIDGRIAVDKVYLYEDLPGVLDQVVERLGLPSALELPDAKREVRKDRRPYQEFYSPKARDYVARICAREIEAFGYKF
jgi:hypothetical protein